ncbi:hypothetical protein EVAR_60227_1 [Eumeta japonica]|uniref:Uncharacterized protein n=1 Tax=Eumeta variegata TaxID=151549 RepID=A0A4C1Z7P8_EUMVA|nr:hypothetical protein EVAR_60227_1 [Eumeta japonica]
MTRLKDNRRENWVRPKQDTFPDSLEKPYKTPNPISEAKKKDLKMDQNDIYPEKLHAWIQILKTTATAKDRVPDVYHWVKYLKKNHPNLKTSFNLSKYFLLF